MLLLAIFGLVLLATPALPVGLLLIWLAWRVYERPGRRDDECFTRVLMTLGGLGVAAVFVQFAIEAVRRLP